MQESLHLAKILGDLHAKWQPHPTQALVGRALFYQLVLYVFLECGRKWGKSEILAYILWRFALSRPNAACYYIGPYQTQMKEIIWANKRLQNFGPSQYIEDINNTELRLKIINGSFIKVDGSDNYEAYRGITPDIIIYDEFKDFRPEFHLAMAPNLAPKKAPLIIAGTPPEGDNSQYARLADEIAANPKGAHFNFPTWMNPHIDRDWLKTEKESLYRRGEGYVWEREYAAKRVKGGPNAVFPMFDAAIHVVDHDVLIKRIWKDRKKMQWFVTADPGNATCFAVLFSAVNIYTKEIYHLDELYVTVQAETSTSRIIPAIARVKVDLFPDFEALQTEWQQTMDEAATWFQTEAMNSFDEYFAPTAKAQNKKEDGLSFIKDQLLKGKMFLSTRCKKLKWEVENYIADKKGQIPKGNDHLIDCARYTNAAAGLSLKSESEPRQVPQEDRPRAFTIEQDLRSSDRDDDELVFNDPYLEDL